MNEVNQARVYAQTDFPESHQTSVEVMKKRMGNFIEPCGAGLCLFLAELKGPSSAWRIDSLGEKYVNSRPYSSTRFSCISTWNAYFRGPKQSRKEGRTVKCA